MSVFLVGPLSSCRGIGAVLRFGVCLGGTCAIALGERAIGRLNTSDRGRIHRRLRSRLCAA